MGTIRSGLSRGSLSLIYYYFFREKLYLVFKFSSDFNLVHVFSVLTIRCFVRFRIGPYVTSTIFCVPQLTCHARSGSTTSTNLPCQLSSLSSTW
jgi:hypothetical protein